MKIYINREPKSGPWGGGNKTVTKLVNHLRHNGHNVVFSLKESDIDIIFCFDPRSNENGEWYRDFLQYKRDHGCKIVQRVGDLGTHGKPELTVLVKKSIEYSDFLIFPSEWAKDWIGYNKHNCEVVHNAPLPIYHKFKSNNFQPKIRLITHHWSTNPKKGFDFYKHLDDYIGSNEGIEFTYIGRLPDGFILENSTYIEATGDNQRLASMLSSSDIYVTASIEEAGANHVLEAMAAGLPILYHEDGGSIADYCTNYGLPFDNIDNFLTSLEDMLSSYENYKDKVMKYDSTIDSVVEKYGEILCNIQK